MSRPNQEDLIGYLLGALEQSEHEQVQRALEQDEELREQLRKLSREIQPLDEVHEPNEKRTGLARRTCEMIAAFDSGREYADTGEVHLAGKATSDGKLGVNSVTKRKQTVSSKSPGRFRQWTDGLAVPRGWTASELGVTAAVCLVLGFFFFPSLLHSRHQARIQFCQNNLRSLGFSLYSYADLHNGKLPSAEATGNRAFAGNYSLQLNDAGLLESPDMLLCPSSVAAKETPGLVLPPGLEVDSMNGEALATVQRQAGGSYAYHLGYTDNGYYHKPMFKGRSNQVIMADSPNYFGSTRINTSHGKDAQNLLLEDLSVRFLRATSSNGNLPIAFGDPIFVNRLGIVAAGVDEFDAVLGASYASPNPQLFEGRAK